MKRVSRIILCGLMIFSVFVNVKASQDEDDGEREDRRGCFARVCAAVTIVLGAVASAQAGRNLHHAFQKPQIPAPFIECRIGERSARLRHSGDACDGEGVVFPLFNNGTDTVFEDSGECAMYTGYPRLDHTYDGSPRTLFVEQAGVYGRKMRKKGNHEAVQGCERVRNALNAVAN